MNLVLTKQGLLHMELLLLETFQWNLYLPTAAHFIEYCLSIAVYEGDLHDGWPIGCLEKTVSYMAKYADYFLEVSLQGKGSISWDLCLCDYIYTYTHIHTITERFSERTKIKNVLKLTKTQLKSLWLLCPPPRSRVPVFCPIVGGCRVCGCLPHHPPPVAHLASAPAAPHCIHLGEPCPQIGRASCRERV